MLLNHAGKSTDHHQIVPGLLEEVDAEGCFGPTFYSGQSSWTKFRVSLLPWMESHPTLMLNQEDLLLVRRKAHGSSHLFFCGQSFSSPN